MYVELVNGAPLMVFDKFWPDQPSNYPRMSEEFPLMRGLTISPLGTLDSNGLYTSSSATTVLHDK